METGAEVPMSLLLWKLSDNFSMSSRLLWRNSLQNLSSPNFRKRKMPPHFTRAADNNNILSLWKTQKRSKQNEDVLAFFSNSFCLVCCVCSDRCCNSWICFSLVSLKLASSFSRWPTTSRNSHQSYRFHSLRPEGKQRVLGQIATTFWRAWWKNFSRRFFPTWMRRVWKKIVPFLSVLVTFSSCSLSFIL